MCDEKTINLFMKTFSNLKTVSWKGVYKQKNDFYRKIYFYLPIAKMILVISWNIMVKKCVAGYRSNYNNIHILNMKDKVSQKLDKKKDFKPYQVFKC